MTPQPRLDARGRRRVVVTGIGLLSPVGLTRAENWESLLSGRSGIGAITKFDTTEYACRIAGEVKGFDPTNFLAFMADARKTVTCYFTRGAS